ncbi:MAG: FmdB family zinc ribbon protein [Candidatus Binatia bacterium]
MPIYEYLCQKCGEFEVTQKITDKPLESCPTCGRRPKKLISNSSFQLKGTGWYLTDYSRKGKAPEGEKAEKAPAADVKGDGKTTSSMDAGKKASAEKKSANEKGSSSNAS